jgi:signal transduction histidine kinase
MRPVLPWLWRSLPNSLIVRIVALQLVMLAMAIVVILIAIHLLLGGVYARFERQALYDRAAAIAPWVRPTPRGVDVNLPDRLRVLYRQGAGGFDYAVLAPDGAVLAASHGRAWINLPAVARGPLPAYTHTPDYSVASFPERIGDRAYWIEIVQNLSHPDVYADDIVRVFLGRIVWFIPLIAVVLLAANGLIVLWTVRPVVRASHRAGAIHPRRTDVRLPERGLPVEIQPLVRAVNQAFDRLAEGFRLQREFAADVAHELRTPLAVLRLRADRVADPALAAAFRADTDAMSHLVDQLLALAELETFTLPPEADADLCRIARDGAALMAPAALAAGVDVECVAPDDPVRVHAHAEQVFRALRNLVENAVTHSRPGDCVTIAVHPDGAIDVIDHGPGIAEADRPRIFRRGWRRDRQAPGHGLGLGIVQRIVEAHDGTIAVHETPGGGATFQMRFGTRSEPKRGPLHGG